MKKILAVVAMLAAFAVAGIVLWYYFDNNFKEYKELGQISAAPYEKVAYLSDSVIKYSADRFIIYGFDDSDNIIELYTQVVDVKEMVFSSADYIIFNTGTQYDLYSFIDDELKRVSQFGGEFHSAAQYDDAIVIKTISYENKAVIYKYDPENALINVTDSVDFSFADYCFDKNTGKEFYISYALSGEYVKIVIRAYSNGNLVNTSEIDNLVYNSMDYAGNMFVFYTDHSMVFINTDTLVRRVHYFYDIDKMQRLIYNNRVAYYFPDAYFDGVNNLLLINKDSSRVMSLPQNLTLHSYEEKAVYAEGDKVKVYMYGESLLEDDILFTMYDKEITEIGIMDDIIAVRTNDSIYFMKGSE